jgi:N-formylmaleamate deformylase
MFYRDEFMTGWSTARCETNQMSMHYTRTGGGKPPFILLHGLTGSGDCWTPVAHALEGEYDVIMPDARGHGKSSVPNNGYRYEDHANDVIDFIKALELSRPIVLGHSMGGMTAALVAARNPKILRGLILADPTFLKPDIQREVYESNVVEQHRQFLNKSFEHALTEARIKHPNRLFNTLKLIIKARLQTSINAFQVLTPPSPDYKQLVSAMDVPSLLVMGDAGVISSVVAEELRSLNPTFQIETISNVGHGLHYDKPEQFVNIVKSYLCSI